MEDGWLLPQGPVVPVGRPELHQGSAECQRLGLASQLTHVKLKVGHRVRVDDADDQVEGVVDGQVPGIRQVMGNLQAKCLYWFKSIFVPPSDHIWLKEIHHSSHSSQT